jgi:putative membrane protein
MGNGGDNGTLYKHNVIMYSLNHFFNRNASMPIVALVLIALVCLIHVYIFLLETVLYKSRGVKVFGIPPSEVESRKAAMSNQGCYNGFLAAALLLGLVYPDPAIARAFATFGLACVAVAGVWGAVTVMVRILYIQTVPAVLGLAALYLL